MATISRFIINGKETNPPIEAVSKVGENGLFVEASFGVENVQPAITPLSFTFPNEAASIVRDFVKDGRIFEGLDFNAEVIGDAGTTNLINGYLDLTDGYQELSPVQVLTNAKFKESTLSLEDKVASITLDLLEQEGFLKKSDQTNIKYVVEKPINAIELIILSITIYLMIKELAESVEKLQDDIAQISSKIAQIPTGSIGAIIYTIAIALVRAAYIAILLKAIIDLMNEIISKFISPVRTQPGLKYSTILKNGFEFLGYGFESNIDELDNFHYMPSILGEPSINAVPSSTDYGYNFGEIVQLARTQFNAKIAVVNGTIQFRSENDPYWLKTSTYVMPDILLDDENPKKYNTDELVKSRILQYKLDDLDDWTVNNYKGTQYTVVTQSTGSPNPQTSGLVGFEYIRFPVALASRKDELNPVEEALKIVAKAVDTVLNVFGSSKNYSSSVKNRVGMVKISHEQTSKPKCVYLEGDQMPINHRDLMSAKYLWDTYINEKSFVANDFKRQRNFYNGVEFGFGLTGFLKTINNSYFYTEGGKIGKFINIKWDLESDIVIADFWVQEVYADKLKEIGFEQE